MPAVTGGGIDTIAGCMPGVGNCERGIAEGAGPVTEGAATGTYDGVCLGPVGTYS